MNIFLSASIPIGQRQSEFAPYSLVDISLAVSAVAQATVLAGFRLVVEAHPATFPLILAAVSESRAPDSLEIYQLTAFEQNGHVAALLRDSVPQECARLHRIDSKPSGDLVSSLETMRQRMLTDHPIAAGIFIGGMESAEREYVLLQALQPSAARLPLSAPGGAARELLPGGDGVSKSLAPILNGRDYAGVSRAIMYALSTVQ